MHQFVSAIVAVVALISIGIAQADTRSLPPLPSGYEQWVHQENRCTLIVKNDVKLEYALNLYRQEFPKKRTFEVAEVHSLNGEPYLVSYFGSRRTVRGYIPLEQKPFEVYQRMKQTFFVRMAKENRWQEFVHYPDTMSGVREIVLSIVDRDYLSVHGTSTSEIKECLRAQSRSRAK